MSIYDNRSFAEEFARRLNRMVQEGPKDMFLLGEQALPTGTEKGSFILWRVFSLLCVEGTEEAGEACLIFPHQNDTTIRAVYGMPVDQYNAIRVRRARDPDDTEMPEPDDSPPLWSNRAFAIELARRVNALSAEYPEWVAHFLMAPLIVRHEFRDRMAAEQDSEAEAFPANLVFVLCLAASAASESDPWGLEIDGIEPGRIVSAVSANLVKERSDALAAAEADNAVKH